MELPEICPILVPSLNFNQMRITYDIWAYVNDKPILVDTRVISEEEVCELLEKRVQNEGLPMWTPSDASITVEIDKIEV